MEINKIYHGDALELIKRIENKSVDVSLTSPPYNRIQNDTYELYDDNKTDYLQMLVAITEQMLRVTRKDVLVNIQMNLCNKVELCKWIGHFAEKVKGIVIWQKNNPQPANNPKNNTYSITNAYEFIFVLNDGDNEFRANNKIKNIISTNVNTEHFERHGAVMKREVAEWLISNFTVGGDIVLDPFMGMGTTALVCAKSGRNYVGFEIIKEYKERAERRIEEELAQYTIFDVFENF